jgi:hypothetical protein
MPKATVSIETTREDLKSCAGAYVELRRMSYGAKLERQGMVSRMKVHTEEAPTSRADRRSGKKQSQNLTGEVEMLQLQATLFSFKHCIVGHNLFADEEETVKLDLTNEKDVKGLDPRIGEEIDMLIDDMNNFEDDEDNELGN